MKLKYPFAGCGEIASVVDSSTINCGEVDPFTNETLYCRKCLTSRLNFVETLLIGALQQNLMGVVDIYEVPDAHKTETANWSRPK